MVLIALIPLNPLNPLNFLNFQARGLLIIPTAVLQQIIRCFILTLPFL